MQKGEIFQEKIRKFSYTFGYSIVPALITMILGSCHSETVIDRLYGKYMSKTLVVINGRMEIEEDSSPVVINIDYSSNQSIHPESCELIDPPSAINILSPCVCINKQCSFKAQPTQNFYGQTSINVQLTDQFGQKSNKGTIILDVTPVNDPPTLQTITDQSIQEDTSLHLEIEAQDIDSELSCSDSYFTASWSNSQLGTHATLSVGGNWPNCQISLTPSPNAFGSSSVTLSLTDGIASTSQSFNVNVQAVNDPPIAQNASFEIQEDTEAIIDLPYVDPDNEPATSCSVTNTDRVAITESCQCVGGVCTVKVLGDIFYNGVAKFDFAVVTNDENSNTATITLNIADSGIIPRVEKLTVGTWSSCALLSNQRVRCWGFKGARMGSGIMGSPQNQLIGHTVFGLTKVVDLVTGSLGTCALRENHSVWCWGEGSSGFIGNGALSNSLVPAKVSFSSDIKISKLAKGGNHSHNCAISDQKKLYCWGAGESGKIGNGTTVNQSSPVEISSLTQVEAVAVGANNTCALVNNDNNPTNGHQLYCWGRNNNGQVGNGSSGADVLSPVFIMDGVTDVSLANATTCAHLADKSLRCWGQRSVGASGTTTGPVFSMLSSPTLPVLKQDGNPLLVENEGAQFIAGNDFVAILEGLSNKLWAWGRNRSGTLGGMQPILWAANQVYHSRSFNQISGSEDLLCGVFNNKQSIECYGTSQAFEGGDTLSDLIGPTLSNFSLTDHLHHTVNENLSAFVTSNGSVWWWGFMGAFPNSNFNPLLDTTISPQQKTDISHAIAVTTGSNFACALIETNNSSPGAEEIKCWGAGGHRQLGVNSTASTLTPQTVRDGTPLTGVVEVKAGELFACARLTNGSIKCWGTNGQGQRGDGNNNANPNDDASSVVSSSLGLAVGLAVGGRHACAISQNLGALYCWGEGTHGKLGNNSITNQNVPVPVVKAEGGNLTNVVSVDAGLHHTCALVNEDGNSANGHQVYCWGLANRTGQNVQSGSFLVAHRVLDVNGVDPLSDAVHLEVGANSSCVIRVGGTLTCWGTSGRFATGQNYRNPDALIPQNVDTSVSGTPLNFISMGGNAASMCYRTLSGIYCFGANEINQNYITPFSFAGPKVVPSQILFGTE